MTADILPCPAALPPMTFPPRFRKGHSANGVHIIDERDTPRGREFLFAGWGVQSWIAEARLQDAL